MKLLVAVSRTPYAPASLEVIARLAQRADVTLLHAAESRILLRPGAAEDLHALPSLVAVRERLHRAGARTLETVVLREDTPSKAILRESKERNADLIVMRGHDRHPGLVRRVFGDTVEEVLEQADRPVLALRVPERESDAKRILLASRSPGRDLLDAIAGVARATSSRVTLLHVQPAEESGDFFQEFLSGPEETTLPNVDAKRALDAAVRAFAERGVEAEGRIREGLVEEQVALEANGGNYWLLVVRGRSAGTLYRIILGHSFTEDIARHVDTSILVVR